MKFCTRCRETKPAEAFCKNKSRSGGLQIYCRSCMADYQRPFFLMKKFGITVGEYDIMFEEQGRVCPICGEAPQKNNFPVDHDHDTGAVRGILCIRCNMNLEWFINHRAAVEKYLSVSTLIQQSLLEGETL